MLVLRIQRGSEHVEGKAIRPQQFDPTPQTKNPYRLIRMPQLIRQSMRQTNKNILNSHMHKLS